MKLRIIEVDDVRRMAGKFVLQERRWGVWNDLYFSSDSETIVADMVLGNANIVRAEFDDFHDACKYGQKYRQAAEARKRIKGVWYI